MAHVRSKDELTVGVGLKIGVNLMESITEIVLSSS